MKRLTTVIIGFFLLASAAPAHADEVTMENGDRISGTVAGKNGDSLIIKTSYAGDISLNWGKISTLFSDANIQFLLADGSFINGRAITDRPGSIKIKSDQIPEAVSISLDQISAINPPNDAAAPTKFSGHANIGLTRSEGNTDAKNIHIDIESVTRTPRNRYTIGAIHNQAETGGVESADNLTGYMKYDYFLTPKWYSFANAIFTKDQYKDLNLKTAVGGGVGHQVFETAEKNLSVELGLNYVNEDYILAEDSSYPAGRWALNYDQLLFKKMTQFFHKHEILSGFEQADDISILSQTGFRFPFIEKLNATLQVNWNWDNTPAPDTKRADTDYLFTLGYSW